MRVLIVDDLAANRRLLRAQLEAEAHEVFDAEDGIAALPILEREQLDAVISDILMPRMDGYRLCYEVRSRERLRQLPFIFYTATCTSANDEKLAYDVGADDYLRKPAARDVIYRSLEAAVASTLRRTAGPLAEPDVLKEYSERLVRRLEERNAELLTQTDVLRESEGRLRALIDTEAQLRQAHKLEAIGQLASGIAHDFNNILATILGNADLARADLGAGHPALRNVDAIAQAGRRAKHLVQQILTFSRQQPPTRSVLALATIVEEAVSMLRATIPAGVELVADIAAGTPHVFADATELHQVLFNLCTNAWHALEEQSGRIDIVVRAVTLDAPAAARLTGVRPGPFACLSVSDTGVGMDADTLHRIFEPFFTTKAVGRGTGLGLSVVHGIVKAHDGAVAVESRPGAGTKFDLYFPAVDSPAAGAAASTNSMAGDGLQPRGEGKCILFLDDEEALVELAEQILGRLGYRVVGVTSPAQALQVFRADPAQFDVVVTDLNMPALSGLEVAARMLAIRPDIRVGLTSGHVTEEIRANAERVGIRQIIYKPSTATEFGNAIHRLIIGRTQ